ncbi:MAG TPA: PRC-barrel domain-containing protein [Sphingomicrobium sp.]
MRLSDLRDTKVRTLDGKVLGRVHEVHVEGGRVVALICGVGSFIESLTARSHGRRIPWECVRKADREEILVVPDPPQRRPAKKKPSASRTRQGTRRASARRSKR